MSKFTRYQQHSGGTVAVAVILLLAMRVNGETGREWNGLSRPWRQVTVACAELGVVDDVFVTKGDTVKEGTPLVRLNVDVLVVQRDIALAKSKGSGRLRALEEEKQLHQERLKRAQDLAASGVIKEDEIRRMRADVVIAEANCEAAMEVLEQHRLEAARIAAMIDRRTLHSPVDGTVVEVYRDVGERVSPSDEGIVELVDLSRLRLVYHLPASMVDVLQKGLKVFVKHARLERQAEAHVYYVAPEVDAASGTVRVELELLNDDRSFRSGEAFTLTLGGDMP